MSARICPTCRRSLDDLDAIPIGELDTCCLDVLTAEFESYLRRSNSTPAPAGRQRHMIDRRRLALAICGVRALAEFVGKHQQCATDDDLLGMGLVLNVIGHQLVRDARQYLPPAPPSDDEELDAVEAGETLAAFHRGEPRDGDNVQAARDSFEMSSARLADRLRAMQSRLEASDEAAP